MRIKREHLVLLFFCFFWVMFAACAFPFEGAHVMWFLSHFLPYLVVFMSQQLKSNVKSKVPKAQQFSTHPCRGYVASCINWTVLSRTVTTSTCNEPARSSTTLRADARSVVLPSVGAQDLLWQNVANPCVRCTLNKLEVKVDMLIAHDICKKK